jgi:hypothetical protein
MTGGGSHELDISTDEAIKLTAPVVKADPGYFRLTFWGQDDGRGWVDRQPVVAWRIMPQGAAPVTPIDEEPNPEPPNRAILYPDGKVLIPFDCQFRSEGEWRTYVEKAHKEELAKANAAE